MSGRPAAAAPECPRTDNGYCYVDVHFDTVITYCPSFGRDSGNCVGKSTGTRDFSDSKYSTGGLPWYTSFSWDGVTKRIVTYQVQISGIVRSMITGEVPGPGSADFRVSSAYTTDDPAAQFRTENLPGKKAGEVGGPLYLNFENGTIGADVYIHGYLKRV